MRQPPAPSEKTLGEAENAERAHEIVVEASLHHDADGRSSPSNARSACARR